MKTTRVLLAALLLSATFSAKAVILPTLTAAQLNQVVFEVNAEQWIASKTAKVIVAVNATMNEEKSANLYQSINQKLAKVADNAAWHITQVERNQDKSGLEQATITAEARLTDTQIANLRSRLSSVSKAGENYAIAAIEYTPTLVEREFAETTLRNQLYQQIKNELTQLNSVYPNQKFFVHNIIFSENRNSPMPGPVMFAAAMEKTATNSNSNGLTVSNKLQLTARVILGSVIESNSVMSAVKS